MRVGRDARTARSAGRPSGPLAAPAQRALAKLQHALVHADADPIARLELAAEDLLRQRIFDLLLDRALERPRTVDRIEARLAEQSRAPVSSSSSMLRSSSRRRSSPELDLDDRADLLGAERMEHDDVIDAVDELRPEILLHDFHHRGLHALVVALARQLLDHAASRGSRS